MKYKKTTLGATSTVAAGLMAWLLTGSVPPDYVHDGWRIHWAEAPNVDWYGPAMVSHEVEAFKDEKRVFFDRIRQVEVPSQTEQEMCSDLLHTIQVVTQGGEQPRIVEGPHGTVSTFYAAWDKYLVGANATFSTARSTQTSTIDDVDFFIFGCAVDAGTYGCYEGFIDFDTSAIPDSDTVSGVTLSLVRAAGAASNLEARLTSGVSYPGSSGRIAGASLGSQTLLATCSTAAWTGTSYVDWTSDGAFPANVNKTGHTQMILNDVAHRTGSPTPTGDEDFAVALGYLQASTTSDPKLVVTHAAGGSTLPLKIYYYNLLSCFGISP